MLLALLPWVFVPNDWVANQAMFTVNRLTNDEVDVTATIADGDVGPYVFVIPQKDFKEAPSLKLTPLGAGFFSGQWRLTSLSATTVGIGKQVVGVGTGSGGIRMFIKRPR